MLDWAIFVLLVLGMVGMACSVLWYSHGTPLRYARRVLVNLDTGNAIEGVLVQKRGKSFTLADPIMHTPGSEGVEIEGRAVVDRARVEFTQVLPSEVPE